ncbi:MAG: energy-coupling factor ABC transporter ATP-binding protein [Candidatus Heimdallarchaeota archaeon]
MIDIHKVSFQYLSSSTKIFENISLQIEKGEFVGIIGPTGCGKSTLCYMLNGLIPYSIKGYFSGDVSVSGKKLVDGTVEEMSSVVGYMLQEPSFQIATPNVTSEIAFGMENLGIAREEIVKRLDSVLETLGIDYLRNRATADLSEGEKQRVILASILAMDPQILVLDECSSMLDLPSKLELATTLKQLNKEEQKTVVMIEHDLDYLLELADRIILINNGQIIADGPTAKILTDIDLLRDNDLVPPTIVSLFHEIKKKSKFDVEIPTSYSQATAILGEMLK